MAACTKFRARIFYTIFGGNKSLNNFPCCVIRAYTTGRTSTRISTITLSNKNTSHNMPFCTKVASSDNTEAALKVIKVAICIERRPVVTTDKTELELQYEELQERLEFEHSSISDFELRERAMMEKKEQLTKDEDNEKLKKEVAALDSEYQELKDIEEQHNKDTILGNRETEADMKNNLWTTIRKLDEALFLLISNSENSTETWQIPQGNVEQGESLRQAAERIAQESIPPELPLQFMSNAPAGVYRRTRRDDGKPDSPKVFFYHAQLEKATHKYNPDTWNNCIWATKDELAQYLPLKYYESVSRFLL